MRLLLLQPVIVLLLLQLLLHLAQPVLIRLCATTRPCRVCRLLVRCFQAHCCNPAKRPAARRAACFTMLANPSMSVMGLACCHHPIPNLRPSHAWAWGKCASAACTSLQICARTVSVDVPRIIPSALSPKANHLHAHGKRARAWGEIGISA